MRFEAVKRRRYDGHARVRAGACTVHVPVFSSVPFRHCSVFAPGLAAFPSLPWTQKYPHVRPSDPSRAAHPISGLAKRRCTGLSPGLYLQGNGAQRYYDLTLSSDLDVDPLNSNLSCRYFGC